MAARASLRPPFHHSSCHMMNCQKAEQDFDNNLKHACCESGHLLLLIDPSLLNNNNYDILQASMYIVAIA